MINVFVFIKFHKYFVPETDSVIPAVMAGTEMATAIPIINMEVVDMAIRDNMATA